MGKAIERLRNTIIIAEAAQQVAGELYQADLIEHDQIGEVEDDLLMTFVRGMNGYVLAKALEDRGQWDVLPATVTILDRMEGFCTDIERAEAARRKAA